MEGWTARKLSTGWYTGSPQCFAGQGSSAYFKDTETEAGRGGTCTCSVGLKASLCECQLFSTLSVLQPEAIPITWEGKLSVQGHTASAWQSWAEASMWVAVPLPRKLVLLGHLASVLRLGKQWGTIWRHPRGLWRKEEALPAAAPRVWRLSILCFTRT